MLFSYRNNVMGTERQFKRLQTRIGNAFDSLLMCFHGYCAISGNINMYQSNWNVIYALADKLGLDITNGDAYEVYADIKDYLASTQEYNSIYDLIEAYVEVLNELPPLPYGVVGVNILPVREEAVRVYNRILKDENVPYQLYNNQIVPLMSEREFEEVVKAAETGYLPVNRHIEKAWEHFSDRKAPDYENSVKESISAVESLCCIITGMSGSQATLGATIKKLKDSGIYIHSAMESAFSKLYGYTSDENGIRHGGIDFTNVPIEDAKYMLVSCAAFVNYLIEKWAKCGAEET